MGGDDKSRFWNVRLTVTTKNPLERIQKWLDSHTGSIALNARSQVTLACLEKEASQHVHAAYECSSELCRSTVKLRLDKFLDLSGNADYSIKSQKLDEVIDGLYRYICKGTGPAWDTQAPVIIRNACLLGACDEAPTHDVKKYHSEFWSTRVEVGKKMEAIAAKAVADRRKKKKEIIEKLVLKHNTGKIDIPTGQAIVADIINEYKGDINDDGLFRVTQSVCYGLDPEQTALNAYLRMSKKLLEHFI